MKKQRRVIIPFDIQTQKRFDNLWDAWDETHIVRGYVTEQGAKMALWKARCAAFHVNKKQKELEKKKAKMQ